MFIVHCLKSPFKISISSQKQPQRISLSISRIANILTISVALQQISFCGKMQNRFQIIVP